MSTRAEPAQLHLSHNGQGVTDKTDEIPISSVLSVQFGGFLA